MKTKSILTTLGVIFGLTLAVNSLSAASVLAYQEGFESDGDGSRYFVDGPGDDGQLAFFARRQKDSIGVEARGGTVEGDWIFGISDLDGLPQSRIEGFPDLVNARKGRLRFENIDVNSLGNLKFMMAVAVGEGTHEADNDMFITIRFDDGEWVDIGGFRSASSNNPPKFYIGPRTTVTKEEDDRLTSFYRDWSWPIVGNGSSLDVYIWVDSNYYEEDYFLDNIRIVGDNEVKLATASFANADVTEPASGSVSNPLTVTIPEPAPAGGVAFEIMGTREAENSISFLEDIIIPAGETSKTFATEVLQDGGFTGTEVNDYLFSANGYNTAMARLNITNTTPEPTGLVIMELHAAVDGSSVEDLTGDANNDGRRVTGDDQFIEIVNFGDYAVDLSGWTIGEEIGDRHLIPEGTVLNPNQALVVFGNGEPRGAFGGAIVQVSTTGGNGLGFDRSSGPDHAFLAAPFGPRLEDVNIPQLADVQLDTSQLPLDNPAYNRGSSSHRTEGTRTSAFVTHAIISGSNYTLFSPGTWPDGSPYFTPENTLQLQLSAETISEDAGANAASGTVTLGSAAPAGGLEITIDTTGVVENPDGSFVPDEIDLDSLTILVPEGQTTANFRIGAVNDGVLDGDTIVSITARGGAYVLPSFAALTVLDVATDDLDVIINEVLIDVAGGGYDVNLDGVIDDDSGDQFIELYNNSGRDVDLSGWSLWWDDNTTFAVDTHAHTFPSGSGIPDGGSLIVMGSITPENAVDPAFGNAIVVQAATPEGDRQWPGIDITIGLNAGNYRIWLQNQHGYVVDLVEFLTAMAGEQNQSVTRSPDITGEFFLHQEVSLSFAAFSPGTNHDGTPFPGNGPYEAAYWAYWPILEGGFVDTGDFLNWIWTGTDGGWLYSYGFNKFIYMEESSVTEGGAWGYIPQ